jgi:hypothetical protein
MDKLPPFEQIEREFQAWRLLCRRLEALGIDVDVNSAALLAALRLWGEELVALRELSPEYTAKALAEARAEAKDHE